uniref:Uncharacterized protein n=1 Tax=Spongospora subterranea TaxID=70186 RepID=A0A0H5R4E1_9EUKA|eukprot:CRZ08766.1 hypothetical protein [Spongospora subterranea]
MNSSIMLIVAAMALFALSSSAKVNEMGSSTSTIDQDLSKLTMQVPDVDDPQNDHQYQPDDHGSQDGTVELAIQVPNVNEPQNDDLQQSNNNHYGPQDETRGATSESSHELELSHEAFAEMMVGVSWPKLMDCYTAVEQAGFGKNPEQWATHMLLCMSEPYENWESAIFGGQNEIGVSPEVFQSSDNCDDQNEEHDETAASRRKLSVSMILSDLTYPLVKEMFTKEDCEMIEERGSLELAAIFIASSGNINLFEQTKPMTALADPGLSQSQFEDAVKEMRAIIRELSEKQQIPNTLESQVPQPEDRSSEKSNGNEGHLIP